MKIPSLVALVVLWFHPAIAAAGSDWFETLKQNGDDVALYRVLHAMPKGGDLHNHNSGSVYGEELYDIAAGQVDNGYRYFTKVRINNCRNHAETDDSYLLMFRTISQSEYDALPDCERQEHRALHALSESERAAWINSLRLDRPGEGREEFFGKHWQRMNAILTNPHVHLEMLYRNARALAEEGAGYLESIVAVEGIVDADGQPITPDEMVQMYRERLDDDDFRALGITVRLQVYVLRFTRNAEQQMRNLYGLAKRNGDILVAINLVGREDNDKGHPRRFLDTLRELRRQASVNLALHGGEVDEPNDHVRDTLLLGARRIGHGLNLITDDELMVDLRYGPYLIEINLISNLLLEYIVDFSQHPFPEYLRTGIPVALSTDDRGMWDSTLTDEFFVAVKHFDLTWPEVVDLSRNSLAHALADEPTRRRLLDDFERKIEAFERTMTNGGLAKVPPLPETRGFICARYIICN